MADRRSSRELADALTELAVLIVRSPTTRAVSVPVIAALSQLERNSGCRLSDLSTKLRIALPTASRLVDRLVELGFATRRRDGHDGRTVRVSITEMGQHALEDLRAERAVQLALLLDRLAPDDFDRIAGATPALARLVVTATEDAVQHPEPC